MTVADSLIIIIIGKTSKSKDPSSDHHPAFAHICTILLKDLGLELHVNRGKVRSATSREIRMIALVQLCMETQSLFVPLELFGIIEVWYNTGHTLN